jgi:DNA adenine methylase
VTDLFPQTKERPSLRYHGSKWRLAPWVISNFPPTDQYDCFVEVFGGGAGVTQRKPRSKIEVYNDLDTQVVNFFRILRDAEQKPRLINLLDLTPFSRDEFELSYEPAPDPVEAARRFVTRCFLGHGTCSMDPDDSNGFRSCDIRAGKSYAREWAGVPAAIAVCADRFTGVTIENLDYRKLIPKFDSPRTLFYVDPPYPQSTRVSGGKGYVHEMCDADHRQLSWLLERVKAKVAISGYPCRLYDELYATWRRVEKATTANGQVGSVPRTEVLWMNYPA